MPIHIPGQPFRHSLILRKQIQRRRNLVVVLSLTAMVDMFVVLVVFLLQSYNSTGQAIHLPKRVSLPKASMVKQLIPSHVVTLSKENIFLEKDKIIDLESIREREKWLISPLFFRIRSLFEEHERKYKRDTMRQLPNMMSGKSREAQRKELKEMRKVTLQVDKDVDFLTVKKVMFTITEAGTYEINFAVTGESLAKPSLNKENKYP